MTEGYQALAVLSLIEYSVPGIPDAVNSGDSDWAELAFVDLELLEQFAVPTAWQGHILMDADDPAGSCTVDTEIQAVGCALAVFDQDDLVGRILAQAR